MSSAAFAPPLFAPGKLVTINGYVGVLPADHKPGVRDSVCRVRSIRYMGEEVGDDQPETAYPRGWEYELILPGGGEWGWEAEATLVKEGYAPADPDRLAPLPPLDGPTCPTCPPADGLGSPALSIGKLDPVTMKDDGDENFLHCSECRQTFAVGEPRIAQQEVMRRRRGEI